MKKHNVAGGMETSYFSRPSGQLLLKLPFLFLYSKSTEAEEKVYKL
ncbi:hypothetical protein EUBHAL_00935 [Anaerobutyricum hallii DSM 3353]|uniref:Uncharacterized protein n=1 Tax=Anaerobutyricum hallii DSM 3353 TaxID=411469 RepID=C0EU51_9FIRM|nr:hypothetical protein EUBHAL_00935 [Anaerobutyricum hallii DSM 3353]